MPIMKHFFLSLLLILPKPSFSLPGPISREPCQTAQLFLNRFPIGSCSNWNPFQCTVTVTVTEAVTETVTETVTMTAPHEPANTLVLQGGVIEQTLNDLLYAHPTRSQGPSAVGDCDIGSATEDGWMLVACFSVSESLPLTPVVTETSPSVSLLTYETATTITYPDDDEPRVTTFSCGNQAHTSLEEMVSIWASEPETEPTSVTAISTPSIPSSPADSLGIETTSSVHSTPSSPGDPAGTDPEAWPPKPRCLKRVRYIHIATFDDLAVPEIPKPYHSMEFSDHFSSFEPSEVNANYSAPSPPFAAISRPSNNSTIRSHMPFNLISMYVGCEMAPACLIRIRGWSPSQVQPAAELHVKVTRPREHWTYADFSGSGFNQLTLLEFDVLDLTTGEKGLLALTLDEIKISRDEFEWDDCFDD